VQLLNQKRVLQFLGTLALVLVMYAETMRLLHTHYIAQHCYGDYIKKGKPHSMHEVMTNLGSYKVSAVRNRTVRKLVVRLTRQLICVLYINVFSSSDCLAVYTPSLQASSERHAV
jgi:hypothetical protein